MIIIFMIIEYIKKLKMKIIQEQDIEQEKIVQILLLDLRGTGLEYIWEEVQKSNIGKESTIEPLIYNLPEITENIGSKINWSNLYGELGERKISTGITESRIWRKYYNKL